MSELEVILNNQSFNEAGGSKTFPQLKYGGMVEGTRRFNAELGTTVCLREAREDLIESAKFQNYTHIFGIKFDSVVVNNDVQLVAAGIGYKLQE